MELVRQDAVSELHSITQSLTESHREEASTATAYVSNLTENALNRLNKQSQELQQMAENDERLDARTRQMITARRNQLRNQAKDQDSPGRAKPKAKTEPNPKSNVENLAAEGENDRGSPEENHTPKRKKGEAIEAPEVYREIPRKR